LIIVGIYSSGIVFNEFLPLSAKLLLGFLFLGTLSLLFSFRHYRFFDGIFIFVLLILGMSSATVHKMRHEEHIRPFMVYEPQETVILRGRVSSPPQKRMSLERKKITFILKADGIESSGRWYSLHEEVLVNLFQDRPLMLGDEVAIEGKLHRPFEFAKGKPFSYRDYLARDNVYWILSVNKHAKLRLLSRKAAWDLQIFLDCLSQKFKSAYDQHFPPYESALMKAVMLGDRSLIPNHITELFVRTGTAHILAISGFNVGVVACVLMIFIKLIPMGRKIQLGVAIILLIAYALMTGASPSVVRATIMAIVFLLSFIMEREGDILNTLCIAAFCILAFKPLDLFDVGFQLSFVCVLAIILWHPVFFQSIFGENNTSSGVSFKTYITQSISVSVTVWIAVLGLIAYYFQIVTPITVLANLFITPLISAANILGLAFLMIHWVLPWMSFAFAACIKVLLNLMIWIIFGLEKVPGAYFYIRDMTVMKLWGYYFALAFILLFIGWFKRKKDEEKMRV
jgi:competence protein ComEC